MKVRILVAILLIVLSLSIFLFAGLPCFEDITFRKIPYYIYASFFCFAATYEFSHVAAKKNFRPVALPAYIFSLTFCFVYHFFDILGLITWYLICIFATIISLVLHRGKEPSSSIVSIYFFIYPISFFVCLILNLLVFESSVSLTALIAAIFGPVVTDTFALFGGMLLGKHKLAPDISPKKTIEGAICGDLFGFIGLIMLYYIQKLWGGVLPFYVFLILALIIPSISQFGDLFASLFKRWADVKDFSSFIPGHGGIMDRIDSYLISGPAVLCIFLILSHFKLI